MTSSAGSVMEVENHAAHGSVHTQVAGQGAGVDAFDAGDAVLLQKVGQGTHGAPVEGVLQHSLTMRPRAWTLPDSMSSALIP